MCFALPLRVISTKDKRATMEDGRIVSLAMVGPAKQGDWLLVQSNLAVDRLTGREARVMRSTIRQVALDALSR